MMRIDSSNTPATLVPAGRRVTHFRAGDGLRSEHEPYAAYLQEKSELPILLARPGELNGPLSGDESDRSSTHLVNRVFLRPESAWRSQQHDRYSVGPTSRKTSKFSEDHEGAAMANAVACLVIMLLALMSAAIAADGSAERERSGGDSSSGSDGIEGSNADENEASDSSGNQGANVLVSQLNKGKTFLVRRNKVFWTEDQSKLICKGGVFLMSRDGPANGACLPSYTQQGISCTCLKQFSRVGPLWSFRVTQKHGSTGVMPKTIESSSVLSVSAIAPLAIPDGVIAVRIIGSGPEPEAIPFLGDITSKGVASDPKLQVAKGSKGVVQTIVIENIDLEDYIKTGTFFRDAVTNLTVKNCNIRSNNTGFLVALPNLKTVNLQNNLLTAIPGEIWQLHDLSRVDLSGNAITNAVVSDEQFQRLQTFQSFIMDPLRSTVCSAGVVKQAQGINFCITTGNMTTNSTLPKESTSGPSEASHVSKGLIIGIVGGCLVIAAMIFLIIRRRSPNTHVEGVFVKQSGSPGLDETLSFDHSSQSVSSSLLNDPIIITHRIPYDDIRIATCISRGGFGLVYSGTFHRRRVAIKKIRSDINADIKQIEMFLREICLMASLSHPRVVEFIGVSWDSLRNLCAVTEFMERGDLRDVLQDSKARNTPLTWDKHKARIAMHVAEALTYLHSLSPKVIHRDLKSKNVLLDNEMTAKLSDFGVSRERRLEESHMTAGIGTAFWIAPEVLLGMDYNEQADIFSFGVLLSEIDTEDYPYWNEKNPASGGKQQENVILRMVATGTLRPEFSTTCPQSILDLASMCLDSDHEKRPTAAQVVYVLQQVIRASPTSTSPNFSTQ